MIVRLLIIAALIFCGAGCGNTKKVEREVGHKGAARRDPFLAAERFFERDDYTVQTISRVPEKFPLNGTLVTPAQSFMDRGMTERVLAWVNRGGHLLVFLRHGEAIRNDWLEVEGKVIHEEEEEPEVQHLQEQLGVGSISDEDVTVSGDLAKQKVSYESPSTFEWKGGTAPSRAWRVLASSKDSKKIAAASYTRGRGLVTIVANAKPFRNRYIGDADNAWVFEKLATVNTPQTIWFLQGMRVSFFAMLWEHAWMAVIPLLALTGFWLWRHLPRFGPMRQAPVENTRDFAAHLGVIGAFHWKHRHTLRLLNPLRDAIVRAATQRGWTTETLGEKLGAIASLPPQRANAVLSNLPNDPQSFVSTIQDLQKIAHALRA